jgi:hypothetical protein
MPTIHLTTFIAQSAEVVFDLSRHVGLHKDAMLSSREEAVAGTRFGLLESGETITWRSRHFFKDWLMRVRVLEMIKPERYIIEQAMGPFLEFRHERYVKPCENGSLLINLIHYEWPQGRIGRIADRLYLRNYLEHLIQLHNETIRKAAEGNRWKTYLMK